MNKWKQVLLAAFTAAVVASPAFAQDDKRWKKDQDKQWKEQNKQRKAQEKQWEKQNKRADKRDKRLEDRDERWGDRDRDRDRDWNRDRNRVGRIGQGNRGRGQVYPYNSLSIPPGHLPPPGECRVWYPDRPAGHQPPPQPCGTTPPGAWVVTNEGDRYRVNMYNAQRSLSGTRYYLAQ